MESWNEIGVKNRQQCEELCQDAICAWFTYNKQRKNCQIKRDGCDKLKKSAKGYSSYRPRGFVKPGCNGFRKNKKFTEDIALKIGDDLCRKREALGLDCASNSKIKSDSNSTFTPTVTPRAITMSINNINSAGLVDIGYSEPLLSVDEYFK